MVVKNIILLSIFKYYNSIQYNKTKTHFFFQIF